jgi:hypothetical protein
MKKTLLAVLAVLMIFSVAAFANGPLLGVSTIPTTGAIAGLSFGYDFGPMNLELWKLNLTTPVGAWIIGALWTPQIGNFGYRVGAKLLLDYQLALAYDGFGFVVGVSQTWGPIQLYGELDLLPTGVLLVVPVVGINILFGDLIPKDDVAI